MTISISPNYELFLMMLFVWWIIKGFVLIIVGLTHAKKDRSTTYGSIEVVFGFVFLLLSACVML